MHSSKIIAQLADGTYYDRIVGHLRHGDKLPLSEDDKEIFARIERTKDLWLDKKDDRLVVNLIMDEFNLSQTQAYNYLNDAKSIYTLFISFNPMTELMLLKERIDKAFELAETNPKAYGKLYGQALISQSQWIKDMAEEIQRNKPEERKQFVFIYHNDFTKIPGITAELMNEWDREFDDLEMKARSRFKHLKVEDVDYTEG